MIWSLNRILNFLFDLVMWPFREQSPWVGLLVGSFLTAAVLVALFAVSSNPSAIRRSRNKLLARTLELLLFQHDLRVGLSAGGRIVSANLAYLYQFLRPMAVGLVPLVLLFVQMECWFERRPLHVGELAVLTVEFAPEQPVLTTPVELQLSEAVRADSSPLRIPSKNEIAWRVVGESTANGWAEVAVAGSRERKNMTIGMDLARVGPQRVQSGLTREIFSPSERPLAGASPIRRIEVSYPDRRLYLGLTEVPWVAAALVAMMGFSLILGQLFGVRIA